MRKKLDWQEVITHHCYDAWLNMMDNNRFQTYSAINKPFLSNFLGKYVCIIEHKWITVEERLISRLPSRPNWPMEIQWGINWCVGTWVSVLAYLQTFWMVKDGHLLFIVWMSLYSCIAICFNSFSCLNISTKSLECKHSS